MNEFVDIFVKLVGSLCGVCFVTLAGVAVNYLRSKLGESEQAFLDNFIDSLVHAAEQTLKEGDFDGSARLAYVQEMLIKAGYELTDAIRAMIESKVYTLNLEAEYVRED